MHLFASFPTEPVQRCFRHGNFLLSRKVMASPRHSDLGSHLCFSVVRWCLRRSNPRASPPASNPQESADADSSKE